MREDVGRGGGVANEHALHAYWDLLLPTDGTAEEDRRRFENLALHMNHLRNDLQFSLDRAGHGGDQLPRWQFRNVSQDRFQSLEHQADGEQGGAAKNLVDEDVQDLRGRADCRAKVLRLLEHQGLKLVHLLADAARQAVDHRLQQQGTLHGVIVEPQGRAVGCQSHPIRQHGAQLIIERHVAHESHQQGLHLVAQDWQAVFRTHALNQDGLLRLQRVVQQ
mmetsp:Transcript_113093/g.359345  ORF Transcript_113093/g.359345 Transcript_113093/m.359345 type:complete len:220 (-) Transcript_113093:5068-5727(-)